MFKEILALDAAYEQWLGLGLKRPFVSLCYAQSLDGALSAFPKRKTLLSSSRATELTHALRSYHDGILIGRSTAECDNPRLTVRFGTGSDPQPIILSRRLEMRQDLLLFQGKKRPWLVGGPLVSQNRAAVFEQLGCRVLRVEGEGGEVSLKAVLNRLGQEGLSHLMIEGGAQVIRSFLQAGLADYVVVTLVAQYLGRGEALFGACEKPLGRLPYLKEPLVQNHAGDLVLSGSLSYGQGLEADGAFDVRVESLQSFAGVDGRAGH